MTAGASEGLGLKAMAKDYGEEKLPILHADASAAIGIAQRKGLGRFRHIDTHTHTHTRTLVPGSRPKQKG